MKTNTLCHNWHQCYYLNLDELILQLFPLILNFLGTPLSNYGQVAKDIRNTMQICGRPYLQERPKKVKYNAIYMV
jgi:hypothetical protein